MKNQVIKFQFQKKTKFILFIVQLCLNHYEQTLKYGGRKNTPSKAEIDLLTAVKEIFRLIFKFLFIFQNGRNGGKRQTFLLPGGTPLTLLTTPSMVFEVFKVSYHF